MAATRHRTIVLALCALCALIAHASPAPAAKSSGGIKPKKKAKSAAPKIVNIDCVALQEPGLAVSDFAYEEVGPLQPDHVEVVVHAACLTVSDVQLCKGDYGPCIMPLVPGREAVGIVAKVGAAVKGLERGDRVAVLLGTGLDSEVEDNGADRSAHDHASVGTTGAVTKRMRVPARWAFDLPLGLESAHAAGLLSAGGAVWSQLTQRKLARGSKIGVLGSGAAGALAMQLSEAMGMEVYQVGNGPQPVEATSTSAAPPAAAAKPETDEDEDDDDYDDDDEEEAAAASSSSSDGVYEYVDANDPEHLRLHTGSFDTLLVISNSASIDLGDYLPLIARGGSVLLAGAVAQSLTLSPRVLEERRLSLHPPPPLSRKATLQMLAFVGDRGFKWPSNEGELSTDGAAAALKSLDEAPDGREVLMQPEEHAKWLKMAKRRKAKAPSMMSSSGLAGSAGEVASAAASASAASLSSVFGVFSKVADAAASVTSSAVNSMSEQAAKLVEQVEREDMEDKERREGALQLGGSGADDEDEEEEEEDEEDADEEEEEVSSTASPARHTAARSTQQHALTHFRPHAHRTMTMSSMMTRKSKRRTTRTTTRMRMRRRTMRRRTTRRRRRTTTTRINRGGWTGLGLGHSQKPREMTKCAGRVRASS